MMHIKANNSFPFAIEELIERTPLMLDEKLVSRQVQNKTILVTGAAGSIGSEIVRQLIRCSPRKLILLDQAETSLYELELELRENYNYDHFDLVIGNISDTERVNSIFKRFQPAVVYHAAAYKHVPVMEFNPGEAIRTNILGTKIVAEAADAYQVEKFVHLSSDKAVNPSSVMGVSKRITELYLQAKNDKSQTAFVTTRFGNVLGSSGSVVPIFMKQIDAGGPVTVTHPEVSRYFMTISEACQLVLEAGAMSQGGEIYLFEMGEPIKIADLAQKMIRLFGLKPGKDIQIEYTRLRPGEKLHEELLNDMEQSIPTTHSKIRIADQVNNRHPNILRGIEALEKLYRTWENETLIKKMEKLIPEFKSRNIPTGENNPPAS